jgi:hypothetical protein
MQRATPLLVLLACLSSCATGAVRLERYRGAYSTHFEGIPDQAEICAVVRNRSARPVEWVELRLQSTSQLADSPKTWRSSWLHQGRIEPGESVSLRFENPPMADEIGLEIVRVGRDERAPRNARPLRVTGECSEASLRAALLAELEQREAPHIEVRPAAQQTPDAPPDSLIATP